jgi:hypothetical protein
VIDARSFELDARHADELRWHAVLLERMCTMNRLKLLNTLLAASIAAATTAAYAQNATPREPTPGQASPTTGNVQNGSPVGQSAPGYSNPYDDYGAAPGLLVAPRIYTPDASVQYPSNSAAPAYPSSNPGSSYGSAAGNPGPLNNATGTLVAPADASAAATTGYSANMNAGPSDWHWNWAAWPWTTTQGTPNNYGYSDWHFNFNAAQWNWGHVPWNVNRQGRVYSPEMRAYMRSRNACMAQPLAQETACNDLAAAHFTGADSKCQKLTGPALADCVQGADHGA